MKRALALAVLIAIPATIVAAASSPPQVTATMDKITQPLN